MVFNQLETSQAQRFASTSLKWTLRGDEEWGGGFIMAKRALIQTPHHPEDNLYNTFSTHLDRNALNAFTVGWEMVEANRYYAVSIGRQWTLRTDASQTILFYKSQSPILGGALIDRWRNGTMLAAQLDVDTRLRAYHLKTSLQVDLPRDLMFGPELSLYRDKNFQRQRLGVVLNGIRMMSSDYALSLGYESDSLAHQGLYTAIMSARRF
jgi:hypothetical protein